MNNFNFSFFFSDVKEGFVGELNASSTHYISSIVKGLTCANIIKKLKVYIMIHIERFTQKLVHWLLRPLFAHNV
jgi:hypothetical protein